MEKEECEFVGYGKASVEAGDCGYYTTSGGIYKDINNIHYVYHETGDQYGSCMRLQRCYEIELVD